MRASLPAMPYSLSSMPSLRKRQNSGSAEPVVSAMRGRLPSAMLLGSRVTCGSVSGLSTHSATVGMVIWRRHLPVWITSGMLSPTGTFSRTKLPSVPLSALTSGSPLKVASQVSQVSVSGTGDSAALGT